MGHFIVEHAVAGQPALSGAARWFGRARIVSLVCFAAALAAGCNLPSGVQSAPPATLTPPPPPASTTPSPSPTPLALLTYGSDDGRFTIQYPQGYVLYIGEKPSVDGVLSPLPDGIAIVSDTSPNFSLSVERFSAVGPTSLESIASQDGCGLDPSQGQALEIGSEHALLFPDIPCGPYGMSVLLLVHGSDAYRLTVESHSSYPEVSARVMQLLLTIQWGPGGDSPSPPVPAWDRARVDDAQLLSPSEGWALVGGSLLVTSDAGAGWREITPPKAEGFEVRDVFFLSRSLGWVALSTSPAPDATALPVQIMRTEDGGETWHTDPFGATLALGTVGAPQNLTYVDPQHGWLTIGQTVTMNSSAADLYRTSDGGLTWDRLRLPFDGRIHFITPSIGWIIGSCCTGAPRGLFRTADGGVTWQEQSPAPNPVEDGFNYNDYALPAFINDQEGVVATTLRDAASEPTALAIYRTHDSGETWEPAASLAVEIAGTIGAGISIPAQFLPPETWIVATHDALFRSQDGGISWESFPQTGLPGFHNRLEFVTSELGWSILFEDNCGGGCLILAQTADGGQTWTSVAVKD